jgi:hypothetical protein
MTKTLNTKQVEEHTDENGTLWPAQTLYRYTDSETGEGGYIWTSTIERAEQSWQRWIDGAPARERRRAETARLRAAVAANATDDSDPFARFDR